MSQVPAKLIVNNKLADSMYSVCHCFEACAIVVISFFFYFGNRGTLWVKDTHFQQRLTLEIIFIKKTHY